jgi:hypothetical protein
VYLIDCIDPVNLKKLLCAWTGWPIPPESGLEIKVEDDTEFMVHSCFNQIEIPSDFTEDQVIANLNIVVEFCSLGFGSI